MSRSSSLIFAILLFLTGCSSNVPEIDLAAQIQEIRAADRALLEAETERDLEAAMLLLSKDAVFQPPGTQPIIGHEEIREFYGKQFNIPYSGIVCESDTIIISNCSDLACLLGNSYYQFEGPDGINRLYGKYITIWQKTSDRWLCVAVSWSGNESSN